MERFYLLTDDDRLDGPYTPAELRRRGIAPETKLWVEDRAAWVEAGKLDGFDSFFLDGAITDEEPEEVKAPVVEESTDNEPSKPLVAPSSPRRLVMVYCWVVSAYILAYIGGVLLMWLTVK